MNAAGVKREMGKQRSFLPLVVLFFCGIGGVGVLTVTVVAGLHLSPRQSQQRRASVEFVPVQAHVVTSEVETPSDGRIKHRPFAKLHYRFTVAGRTYTASDYTSFGPSWDLSLVRKHPVGSTVTAYYDPGNPACAVLDQNASTKEYFNLKNFWISAGSVGLGMVALAALLFPRAYRKFAKA